MNLGSQITADTTNTVASEAGPLALLEKYLGEKTRDASRRMSMWLWHASRHNGPKTALRSDGALGRAAVSVIGGPGLAVRAAAGVEAALHGSHASHPHGLMESVALVLQGRQVKICNTIKPLVQFDQTDGDGGHTAGCDQDFRADLSMGRHR